MWGFGGRYYWGRKERGKIEGIVVAFAWMSSADRHLKNYVDLFASLGWNSLICHSQFLNLFFPDKAASLALQIVDEVVQELKLRPCPVVFASFSGGPKACMYKVVQVHDDCRLIRNCVSGHIFDSTPVDFVSDLGTRFVLHPSVLKISRPPRLATWIAKGISSSLDALFLRRFESERAEYWQTLYSTVSMGAPYLILCSEDDDLAPFQIIFNFATRLKDLGAEVNLVKWSSSSHVGMLLMSVLVAVILPAVSELLGKAADIYSHKIRQLEGEKVGHEGLHDQIPNPFGSLTKATAESSQGFPRSEVNSEGRFFVPFSLEYHEDRVGSVHDEHVEQRYVPLTGPAQINMHGILGHFLFDVCIPKNVEDWDIRASPMTLRRGLFASGRRNSHFNPIIKCIRRSRL
ncbi:Protein of unknown function DUF829- transmembrane 53 [Striga hermonthica]|uniref:DUF829 domain-containing protein n=1 Tax=Striga hermonthica TaxID=68872 RepID=A0A9N7RGZ2_STRHE|nr:Protein of unknown function DUF829- transmembrane 53 [Striga hermonthica]